MAIKDQCNRCRYHLTEECLPNVVYDGTSCYHYARKIDLTKTTDQISNECCVTGGQEELLNETTIVSSEELKKTTNIHGWLSFFLFSIVLGGTISALYQIFMFNHMMNEYGSVFLALVDLSSGLMLGALALYTLYEFLHRKPDAVFLAKTYVVTAFLSNLIALFIGEFESSGLGSLSQIIRSLIWGIIWFSYLCISKQVASIIPKSFRRTTSLNYYIIAALILVPSFFLGTGILVLQNNNSKVERAFIQKAELSDGEFTDGRIIFKKPYYFNCTQRSVGNPAITLFELENSENVSITICSDYDADKTWSNFDEYWENWKDEEANSYRYDVVKRKKGSLKANDYFYKSACYHLEVDVYWRFIMIFDKSSNKVCLVSSYDRGDSGYFDELVNSIRF